MEREVLPFKTVIQELLAGQDLLVDPLVPAVIEAWGRVIPESLRHGICLEGIREGTLCLSVSNPAAGQQFQFLKDFVRDKINEILGKPVVQGFRMKPGSPPTVRQKEKTEPAGTIPRPLSEKEKKEVRQLCARIKNPEVRRQVRAAMQKSRCFESDPVSESVRCKPPLPGKS
jgi:hypothetical protein